MQARYGLQYSHTIPVLSEQLHIIGLAICILYLFYETYVVFLSSNLCIGIAYFYNFYTCYV